MEKSCSRTIIQCLVYEEGRADVSIFMPTESVSITHKFGKGKSSDINVSESFDPKTPVGSDVLVTLVAHVSGSRSDAGSMGSSAYIDPVFTLSEEDSRDFAIIYSPNLYGDGPPPELPDSPSEVVPEPNSFALIGTGVFVVVCLSFRRFDRSGRYGVFRQNGL